MAHLSPAEMEAHMGLWKKWMGGLAEAGKLAGGLPLAKEGKQVINGGDTVTDGPFAETKETLGGYYLLDCKDLDEAIELAAMIPGARFGSVEVRPVMVFD